MKDESERGEAMPRLILASASPRRRELIALLGLPYEILPSRYEEPPAPTYPVPLDALVLELAENKARDVAGRVSNALVLGADTLVTLAEENVGVPLGKPTDADDARRMLGQLSGNQHSVYTGVALLEVGEAGQILRVARSAVRTRVRFRAMPPEAIEAYVASGEPMDKAGAYGAQGYAAPFIEGYEGDFFNVVGLPVCEVGRLLEVWGIRWYDPDAPSPLRATSVEV